MQEVFEKIIEKLEEYEYENLVEHDSEMANHCKQDCNDINDCTLCVWDKAIEIVKQEAEKFVPDTNVGSNGWIPCSERLPEYGEVVMCSCTNGGITISCITHKGVIPSKSVRFGQHRVIAWKSLPSPYQPKGE